MLKGLDDLDVSWYLFLRLLQLRQHQETDVVVLKSFHQILIILEVLCIFLPVNRNALNLDSFSHRRHVILCRFGVLLSDQQHDIEPSLCQNFAVFFVALVSHNCPRVVPVFLMKLFGSGYLSAGLGSHRQSGLSQTQSGLSKGNDSDCYGEVDEGFLVFVQIEVEPCLGFYSRHLIPQRCGCGLNVVFNDISSTHLICIQSYHPSIFHRSTSRSFHEVGCHPFNAFNRKTTKDSYNQIESNIFDFGYGLEDNNFVFISSPVFLLLCSLQVFWIIGCALRPFIISCNRKRWSFPLLQTPCLLWFFYCTFGNLTSPQNLPMLLFQLRCEFLPLCNVRHELLEEALFFLIKSHQSELLLNYLKDRVSEVG